MQGEFSFPSKDNEILKLFRSLKFRSSPEGKDVPRYMLAGLNHLYPVCKDTGLLIDKLGVGLSFAFLLGARNMARTKWISDPNYKWQMCSYEMHKTRAIEIGDRLTVHPTEDFVSSEPAERVFYLVYDGHQYPAIREFTRYPFEKKGELRERTRGMVTGLEPEIERISGRLIEPYNRIMNTAVIDNTWEEELTGWGFEKYEVRMRFDQIFRRVYFDFIQLGIGNTRGL